MNEKPTHKICNCCGEDKPADAFRPGGVGSRAFFRPNCKECEKALREEKKAQSQQDPNFWTGTKVCSICEEDKPKTDFYNWSGELSGPCKSCYCGKRTAAYEANPQAHADSVKKWKENNPEEYRRIRDEGKKKFEAKPDSPKKRRAREAFKYALDTGKVEWQPFCEVCPAPATSAHHFCYDPMFRLDVQIRCSVFMRCVSLQS